MKKRQHTPRPRFLVDAHDAQEVWKICEWRRKDLGCSKRSLAARAGLQYERLTEFLNGRRQMNSTNLDRLLYVLGLCITAKPNFRWPEVSKPVPLTILDADGTASRQQGPDQNPPHQ